MRKVWRGVLLGLCVAVSLSVHAASARLQGSTVFVNEVPAMTLRTKSFSARGASIVRAISGSASGARAKAVARGRRAADVVIGSKVIVSISKSDALAVRSTPLGLAEQWASSLNKALALPPLQVGSNQVRMGEGREVVVPVIGSMAAKATIAGSDETIVAVKREPGQIRLKANGSGTARIVIAAKEHLETISVSVVPAAARFPQNVSAMVTGLPATDASARGAVEQAIWSQLETFPGADLKFSVPEIGPIPAGDARTIAIRVKAGSPNAMTAEGQVNVTVRNQPRRITPESELWYCNYPESLKGPGQVFGAYLNSDQPARMLYHHINETAAPLVFQALLVNASATPAQVLLIPGDSPIDKNPVLAGIDAAERFFRNYVQSSGEMITLPPMSTTPIALRRLAPKDTVSGLLYMALLSGEKLFVRADAKPIFTAEGRVLSAMQSNSPWRVLGSTKASEIELDQTVLSEHIFPQPFRNIDVSYQVGGRHGFVRIGQTPIQRVDGLGKLDGNFGVVYTINTRLDNPTSISAEIEVVFEASAGYSGALFAVNGQMIRTPLLQPKDERRILKLRLDPGTTREFTMQTIPLSGSSYPATLAIRPLETTMRALAASGQSGK